IFRAEIEDMAELDAARRDLQTRIERGEGGGVVLLRRRGVERGPFVDDALHGLAAVEIDIRGRRLKAQVILVAKDLAFAGRGEDEEFMAEVAADRSGIGD